VTADAPFNLEGQHALIAGVGGPLARPVAVALAEAGATVSLMTQADERTQEVEAQSILNECWSLGRDGQVARLDSTDKAAVEDALDRLEAQLGPVDVLATVHQPVRRIPATSITREDWDAAIAVSGTSVAVPVLALGRRMAERGSGRIVNVVSRLHEGTEPETALFAASQGAVLAFTRALAVEWEAHGVFVAALEVGNVESGSGPHAHADLRVAVRDLVTNDLARRASWEAKVRG
jgi:NAD(P)-dependent dehydrogenase (short-subunit alcohol dehydrogenase family)